MKLGSTLQWIAPADECTSSLKLFDSIEDQWRSLFESSTLGVAMIDSGFRFLIANPTFLTMFGYSSEELRQLSFLDICIDEARDECRDSPRARLSTGGARRTIHLGRSSVFRITRFMQKFLPFRAGIPRNGCLVSFALRACWRRVAASNFGSFGG
jgi:PAS domain-containing protein